MELSSRASFTMPPASRDITSALTGPSTIEQTSLISSLNSLFSLETSDGLVVTPSIRPRLTASLISAMLAVSKKNFMGRSFHYSLLCPTKAATGIGHLHFHKHGKHGITDGL